METNSKKEEWSEKIEKYVIQSATKGFWNNDSQNFVSKEDDATMYDNCSDATKKRKKLQNKFGGNFYIKIHRK